MDTGNSEHDSYLIRDAASVARKRLGDLYLPEEAASFADLLSEIDRADFAGEPER